MTESTLDLAALRRESLPVVSYPPELPVVQCREDIAAAIAAHQVVVIAGETGSGKTTQIPKICLELGRGIAGQIGHTQPRRLAARTVARRIAEELNTALGDSVGYQVRFSEQVSPQTHIKLMTDGILLAEIQRDRLLRQYDTLIIDEAHERSLNIDFLLGYLRQLLPRRPDLKLIITSATIDVESFSRHFGDAPVINVEGRSYPVQTSYLGEPAPGERDATILSLIEQIDRGALGPRGDVLVFLSGERDIRELARLLRQHSQLDVLPLYARLAAADQNRVFDVSRRQGLRVVLATNVAETSLTVPGIRYVIDPGDARISRYSFRSKMQRLPIEAISQASANQRRGRCGRVGPGVCLRLYTEEDFDNRSEYTDPEIRRTNLAAVILQMLQLGLGKLDRFPFIDPPDPRMVRDGYRLLEELGAVNRDGRITTLGRDMARMPVDPRLARMVLAGRERGCLPEVLIIASALSVQDPRERPPEKRQQSDQQHARFADGRSDFMSWLALWRYVEEERQSLSRNQFSKRCRREFLSYLRLQEWRDVHRQLTLACRALQWRVPAQPAAEPDYEGIHRSLLSGLLSQVAQRHEGSEYMGCRNRRLQIFPASGQFKKRPPWLVAAEVVETSKVYAREVAAIDPGWLLDSPAELLKRHYYEPRWQGRSGRAMAFERVTLLGLTIADRRSVHYGPIAPEEARELLIREGLISGRCRQPPAFLRYNLALVAQLEDLESRTRRRDLVADDEVLFAFYDRLLPENITTLSQLRSWLKKDRARDSALRMPDELPRRRAADAALIAQFPNELQWQDLSLPLSYHFEPGHDADGVTLTVPLALLNRVPRYRLEWLIPGLLQEACIQRVKGLPKEQRKRLVPVPDRVATAMDGVEAQDTPLCTVLAQRLQTLAGVPISAEALAQVTLDPYYQMRICVVDASGETLATGRDLGALVESFRGQESAASPAGQPTGPQRQDIRRWDFGDLPAQYQFEQAGLTIVSYPALIDRGDSVDLVLCDYPEDAWLEQRRGLLRLLRLRCADGLKYLRKQLLRGNDMALALAACGLERAALVDELIDAALLELMADDWPDVRSEAAFAALLARVKPALVATAEEAVRSFGAALTALAPALGQLARTSSPGWQDSRQDIEAQVAGLLAPGSLRDTPADWRAQLPRYAKGIATRVQSLAGQLSRDQQRARVVQALQQPLQEALELRPALCLLSSEACQYRWLLEEFRVSLFAQSLGTRQAVSEKRLRQQWQRVEQWLLENPR